MTRPVPPVVWSHPDVVRHRPRCVLAWRTTMTCPHLALRFSR